MIVGLKSVLVFYGANPVPKFFKFMPLKTL